MPFGYLFPVALVAIGTLFALRPLPFWSHPLGRVSYFFGLAANELPFAAFFYLLLLPTALAFAQGDIHSAGKLGGRRAGRGERDRAGGHRLPRTGRAGQDRTRHGTRAGRGLAHRHHH